MKKLYIVLALVVFLFTAGALFFAVFDIEKNGIKVKEGSRPLLKSIAKKINGIVYQKATQYNPQGDVVPDGLDNSIKEKIKENIK